jgi:DNA polymerase-3 subunit epsilon
VSKGLAAVAQTTLTPRRQRPAPLPPRISADEEAAHAAYIESMGENAIWKRFAS